MKREHYKTFIIEARSSQLQGNLGWDSMFNLEKHDGQGVTITAFFLPKTYESEDDAIDAALVHGRKKVDDGFSSSMSGYERRFIVPGDES